MDDVFIPLSFNHERIGTDRQDDECDECNVMIYNLLQGFRSSQVKLCNKLKNKYSTDPIDSFYSISCHFDANKTICSIDRLDSTRLTSLEMRCRPYSYRSLHLVGWMNGCLSKWRLLYKYGRHGISSDYL